MQIFKRMLFIILMLFLCERVYAKKHCKAQLDKLQKIQTLQRQGHSLKQTNSLRKREDIARDKWWKCKHSPTYKKKVKSGKKHQKKTKKKLKTKPVEAKNVLKARVFNTTKPIVIKSKYQGNKKFAWLRFYQQPEKCLQPKNIQIFAFCSENKREQRLNFEKKYQ